jgi:hypothetical protein
LLTKGRVAARRSRLPNERFDFAIVRGRADDLSRERATTVIPAKAGIHFFCLQLALDSGLRRNDEK